MCQYSYIKESHTIKMNMIFCKLLDTNQDEMEQICRFQRYCNQLEKYTLSNENNCKLNLMDGA